MIDQRLAEFEAWLSNRGWAKTYVGDGKFKSVSVQLAWEAYQEAFESAAKQHDEDLRNLQHERARADRLQRILDTRPAINAGLTQTYIEWTQKVYIMDASHALETAQ